MNNHQLMVLEFHETFECPTNYEPTLPTKAEWETRLGLIEEELVELHQCWKASDILGVADNLADLLYVVYGAAVTCGIDLEPIFLAVHLANMKKQGGGKREDGKILKPENWQAPDIAANLRGIRGSENDPETSQS